jgi:DNA-directed RNA polymerase subunit E'/Rpb7
MEQVAIFEEKISLSPLDFRAEITTFDSILLEKLRVKMEGKCSQHGYVIPNTLQILSRSLGYGEKGRFTADFMYYIKAQGKVYNPPDGSIVEGEVIRKNKMGLYLIIEDAIRVMVPRDLHIGNEQFDNVEIGERVTVQIKKSQFQVNDTHILSVGVLYGTQEQQPVEDEKLPVIEKPVVEKPPATIIPAAEDEDELEEEEEEEE